MNILLIFKKVLDIKLVIFLIFMGALWFAKGTYLAYPILIGLIVWIYNEELNIMKVRVRKCLKFLILDASFLSLVISLIVYEWLYFIEDRLFRVVSYVGVFVIIYSLFYILLAIRTEIRTARFTILIVTTAVSIMYMVLTTIINFIPLNTCTLLILDFFKRDIELINILENYDIRIIANIFIQLITYPIWLASLIGTTAVEGREYLKHKTDEIDKVP
ncbi:MAG: hypothetical protein KID02_05005 [Clostridiales bacterium]|nr:hypothetical protein [Clostridiales bacterium]